MSAHQLLASGRFVVVPSEAAAQQLRNLHDAEEAAAGHQAWSPAFVLTWDQWLRSLWSDAITAGTEARLLLNRTQEHSLWRAIAESDGNFAGSLSSPESLAELSAAAWRLSESYGATNRLQEHASTHDARIFARWAEAFVQACKTEGYVSRASLERVVQAKLGRGELHLQQPLLFAGFPGWKPAQERLLRALHGAGHDFLEAQIVVPQETSSERSLLQADTEEAELEAVARWVRTLLKHRSDKGLVTRVGVLVPDLQSAHDMVSSAFRKVLAPELQYLSAEAGGTPFELSVQNRLLAEPMIATALDLVRWATGPLSREAVSALLLSPYFTPEAALERAARFDACTLRQASLLRPEVTLPWLLDKLKAQAASPQIAWPFALARFLQDADDLDAPRSFARWTEFMRGLLRSAGWPAVQTQNARELATARAWDHALDAVATLDFRGTRATFHDTLHALERELAHTHLRSNTGRAPVQILDPSEAEGTTFDALIFARFTDKNWPDLPPANPLIAWQLQATLGMPGAVRAETMREARTATARLLHAATEVVFSFASANGDGQQRLSPLVAELNLPLREAVPVNASESDAESMHAELVEDTTPLAALPSAHVHGGATVLQYQAACGFRAFAEIRLRSQEPEARDLGHDARERGNVLHTVMQQFWKTLETQQALRAMPVEKRHELLRLCIDQGLAKHTQEGDGWDAAYLHVQKQRLFKLLRLWIDQELKRPDFTVSATEAKKNLSVGPLALDVRVDRIDRTEDGEILIDYKTGSAASTADWEGERPEAPQLPLYALIAREEQLAGLAFAKVRPGAKMGWQGYGLRPSLIPGRDTVRDLDFLQNEWHSSLETLAESFASGDIRVDPKTYPSTCSFCAQRLLCRLDAASLLDTEDPEDRGEEEQAFE